MISKTDWIVEQLKKNLIKLHTVTQGIVNAMITLVETRDPYTAGHQKRVAELSIEIAKQMNLPTEQINCLYLSALLHDIGKIIIPSEILNRPGQLTEAEYKIIKSHPEVGYDILKSIPFPWPIAKIVLQHHERLDGSGYPAGLKGNQILIESKILAVADVVEAISSNRPYRPSRGIEKALEEIVKNKGKLYDEKVVQICVQLFSEGNFCFDNGKNKTVTNAASHYPGN